MSFAFLILKNMEKWKEIQGFDGRYLISDKGAVKNSDTGRIMKKKMLWSGYERIGLRKDNRCIYILVHRLVLMAFDPIDVVGKLQGNHKNKNRSDNRLENLEWVTHKQNTIHKFSFIKGIRAYEKLFLEAVNKLVPF